LDEAGVRSTQIGSLIILVVASITAYPCLSTMMIAASAGFMTITAKNQDVRTVSPQAVEAYVLA
jgi:hypothetical protein